MQLTWQKQTDAIFGEGYTLLGLPEGAIANARRSVGFCVADAFIGGRYLNHHGRTIPLAMKRLQADIDRRSIGLLGVDDVTFVVQP